jgi:hypothetical protein
MADRKTFEFADVNPGLSGMTFAAEAEGGECVGVCGVRPGAVAGYESFFGRNSVACPGNPVDVVLVSLPFSIFAGGDNVDPAVAEPIRQASALAKLPKKTAVILFRVPWAHADRLGVAADEYLSAIGGSFSAAVWSHHHIVSDDGRDLFVCVIAKSRWNGLSPLPATIGPAPVLPNNANPQEILSAYGYPDAFALHNAGIDPKLIDGVVCVGNARSALSAALASVR